MPRAAGTVAKKRATKPEPEREVLEGVVMDDWFVPLDDVIEKVNILLYGREGSGKTSDLARLVNLRPEGRVLIINAEGGVKISPLRKRGVDTSRVVIWPDPKKGEVINHKSLDRLYRRVQADLMRDPESWIGIGMDSVTEVYQAVLDDVQQRRVQVLKNKGADPDEFFVDIADYGTMSKMVRDLFRKFRDLPCHVVFTALERRDIDKDTGKPQYGPDVTPALQKDVLGYVDLVLMCKAEDEDGPFRALTRGNSRYRAKDRFDVLPRVMAEPACDRIIQYVNGDLTEDTDPFQDDLPSSAKTAQDRKRSKDDDDEDESSDDD